MPRTRNQGKAQTRIASAGAATMYLRPARTWRASGAKNVPNSATPTPKASIRVTDEWTRRASAMRDSITTRLKAGSVAVLVAPRHVAAATEHVEDLHVCSGIHHVEESEHHERRCFPQQLRPPRQIQFQARRQK